MRLPEDDHSRWIRRSRSRVFNQIYNHPGMSVRQIAKRLNLSRSDVETHLRILAEDMPFIQHFREAAK